MTTNKQPHQLLFVLPPVFLLPQISVFLDPSPSGAGLQGTARVASPTEPGGEVVRPQHTPKSAGRWLPAEGCDMAGPVQVALVALP